MDRMIYLGMSGAKMDMQRQEVLANNLANVSTTGFKAELHAPSQLQGVRLMLPFRANPGCLFKAWMAPRLTPASVR